MKRYRTTHRPDEVRVSPSNCLNCGKKMDALGTGSRHIAADPEPGDVTICMYCGAVMRLDENLRVRGMTDQEMDELVADKEWMTTVAKMVGQIKFINAMKS